MSHAMLTQYFKAKYKITYQGSRILLCLYGSYGIYTYVYSPHVTITGRCMIYVMDAAIVCNNCNSVLDDYFGLIHEGYWPDSTTGKSLYIFDQDAFRFFSILRLHGSWGTYISWYLP